MFVLVRGHVVEERFRIVPPSNADGFALFPGQQPVTPIQIRSSSCCMHQNKNHPSVCEQHANKQVSNPKRASAKHPNPGTSRFVWLNLHMSGKDSRGAKDLHLKRGLRGVLC